MQVLIIEDESRAANQLQNLLKKCNFDYELLGIIDTVEDAVIWLNNNPKPDLIFMDIQLADGLSFEIFQKIEVEAPIIFTTAFDQYAIQAFKVNSVDYLLKPIKEPELQAALDKYTKSNKSTLVQPDILKQLLSSIQGTAVRQGVLVKSGSAFVQVAIAEFHYFYSEDSITFGVTSDKRYIIDETLDQLYDTLDQVQFYKINRGQVIQKFAVHKIEPYFNHRVKLSITNPREQEFVVSRTKTTDFKGWMNR